MSLAVFFFLAFACAAAAFVQGTAGMGFALVMAPILGVAAPQLLPAALLLLMLPLNGFVIWRERTHLDISGAGWITLGRLLGTTFGIWIIVALTPRQLNGAVGAVTVLAALGTMLAPVFEPGRLAFLSAGLVTGVMETSTGIGGPPLALVYQHHKAPILRSTVALCFLLGELVTLAVFLALGRIQPALLRPALALMPCVLAGAYLSQHLHARVDRKVLRIAVVAFSLASGIVVFFRAL